MILSNNPIINRRSYMINPKTLEKVFLNLLTINSPSKKERMVHNYICKYLNGIADKVKTDNAGKGFGGDCGNIVAKFKGGKASAPTVILLAHMDTVTETSGLKIVKKNGVIKSDGTTILGADDKAGIAVMLGLAQELKKPAVRKNLGNVELVFTPAEEIGLYGVTHLDFSLVNGTMAYVLDSNEPVGHITTSSPSAVNITAKIHGKAAHAGAEPEKGVNAISIASKAISKMRLGRLDKETTANIGIINGGKATNIVPDLVTAEGESRSFSKVKLEKQIKHMEKCFVSFAKDGGGSAEVTIRHSFETYCIPDKHPLVATAMRAAKQLGVKFITSRSGGGSDANVLNRQGIPAVVVGLGYKGPHTEHEELAVKDLKLSARYIMAILEESAK
jgi:tripeptide aminopeptidase